MERMNVKLTKRDLVSLLGFTIYRFEAILSLFVEMCQLCLIFSFNTTWICDLDILKANDTLYTFVDSVSLTDISLFGQGGLLFSLSR